MRPDAPIARRLSRAAARAPDPTVVGVGTDPDFPPLHSAVAAVLQGSSRPHLLLARRADRDGDPWSGHVALPGGRLEPGDADLVATAIREAREEVGIELGTPEAPLLGALEPIRPRIRRAPDVQVHPLVFALAGEDARPRLTLEPREIVAVEWVDLEALADPARRVEHVHELPDGGELRMPAVELELGVLWGITLRIVEQLLEAAGVGAGDFGPTSG